MDFKSSETKRNLMRAFAGESQARNRYTIAAAQAKEQKLHVIEAVFSFTAEQERRHAEVFYNHLSGLSGETVSIDGGYPVDVSPSVSELLRFAQHNEYEEYSDVYRTFGETAKKEGFTAAATSFFLIAEIEKLHGDRFRAFAELMEKERLFVSDVQCRWMCLNCGYIYEGTEVPAVCPACLHDRGFFIRLELAPYTGDGVI